MTVPRHSGASRAAGRRRIRAGGAPSRLGAREQADARNDFRAFTRWATSTVSARPRRASSRKGRRRSWRRRSSRSSAADRRRTPTRGRGSCYVEFGHGQVGRVDVDFLSGPKPTGTFQAPSAALVEEKAHFGVSRLQRWFGRQPVSGSELGRGVQPKRGLTVSRHSLRPFPDRCRTGCRSTRPRSR